MTAWLQIGNLTVKSQWGGLGAGCARAWVSAPAGPAHSSSMFNTEKKRAAEEAQITVRRALQPVFEARGIEIHKEPRGWATHAQVGQQLCLVRREQRRNRLNLQDDGTRRRGRPGSPAVADGPCKIPGCQSGAAPEYRLVQAQIPYTRRRPIPAVLIPSVDGPRSPARSMRSVKSRCSRLATSQRPSCCLRARNEERMNGLADDD